MGLQLGIKKEELRIRSLKVFYSGIRKEKLGKFSRPGIPLPVRKLTVKKLVWNTNLEYAPHPQPLSRWARGVLVTFLSTSYIDLRFDCIAGVIFDLHQNPARFIVDIFYCR
jgi:hypothetical protein